MTPERALAWLERRGWSIQCHGDDPGSFFVTATHPGPNTAHDWIQLNGAYAESHDASILALVAALRPPRREPSGEWRQVLRTTWRMMNGNRRLDCVETTDGSHWLWAVHGTVGVLACGESRTLRLAQLAAERAASRVRPLMRLAGLVDEDWRGGHISEDQAVQELDVIRRWVG